jgi:hypothetical protein
MCRTNELLQNWNKKKGAALSRPRQITKVISWDELILTILLSVQKDRIHSSGGLSWRG